MFPQFPCTHSVCCDFSCTFLFCPAVLFCFLAFALYRRAALDLNNKKKRKQKRAVLYCIVLHCIVLYCIVSTTTTQSEREWRCQQRALHPSAWKAPLRLRMRAQTCAHSRGEKADQEPQAGAGRGLCLALPGLMAVLAAEGCAQGAEAKTAVP